MYALTPRDAVSDTKNSGVLMLLVASIKLHACRRIGDSPDSNELELLATRRKSLWQNSWETGMFRRCLLKRLDCINKSGHVSKRACAALKRALLNTDMTLSPLSYLAWLLRTLLIQASRSPGDSILLKYPAAPIMIRCSTFLHRTNERTNERRRQLVARKQNYT